PRSRARGRSSPAMSTSRRRSSIGCRAAASTRTAIRCSAAPPRAAAHRASASRCTRTAIALLTSTSQRRRRSRCTSRSRPSRLRPGSWSRAQAAAPVPRTARPPHARAPPIASALMLLGVDVGGTFTDAVLVASGRLHTAKAPTTPADQSRGVMAAVEAVLASAGAAPADVRGFAHGMTVATNALLEGRGARTALVATEGFADIVELGRQARADLYRLCAAHPAPLVPAERRFGAPERMGPGGPLRPLGAAGAARLADAVAGCEPESVAVCLLHSYRHPQHEMAIGDALRARLGERVHVSLSHEVVGTFREYERAA